MMKKFRILYNLVISTFAIVGLVACEKMDLLRIGSSDSSRICGCGMRAKETNSSTIFPMSRT
jgi:hypothetical protein